jgi:hypothetical protein
VGSLTSHNPIGLHGLLRGQLYFTVRKKIPTNYIGFRNIYRIHSPTEVTCVIGCYCCMWPQYNPVAVKSRQQIPLPLLSAYASLNIHMKQCSSSCVLVYSRHGIHKTMLIPEAHSFPIDETFRVCYVTAQARKPKQHSV